jgi:predicted HTH transcriptional regulator
MEEKEFRERVIRLLESIDSKLDMVEVATKPSVHAEPLIPEEKRAPLDVAALLSLEDHLRKTAMVVSESGSVTAKEVAEKTGRTRAAESDYLNQLVKRRYLTKKRKGRTVYFEV